MVADHPTDAYIYNDTSFNSEVFNVSENTEYPSIVPPGIPLPIGIRHHAPFGENQLLLRLLDYEGKTLKTVTFSSSPASTWVVTFDGVGSRSWGGKNNEVDPSGQFYPWAKDYDFRNQVQELKYAIRVEDETLLIPAVPKSAAMEPVSGMDDDYKSSLDTFLDMAFGDDKKIADEIRAAFPSGPDHFKDAFSSDENFKKAMGALVKFPGLLQRLEKLHIINVLLIVLRKWGDVDKENFPKYVDKLVDDFKKVITPDYTSEDFIHLGTFAGMQTPFCDDAIVKEILERADFPKKSETWEVGLQFLQKPETYFVKDPDYVISVFNSVVQMAPAEVKVQKDREFMLDILKCSMRKGIDGEKLVKFVNAMLDLFDAKISGDAAVPEDDEYKMEGYLITKLSLPALEFGFYSNAKPENRIPQKIIDFMSQIREEYLTGTFLSYSLDILKTGSEADTEYANSLATVFATAINNPGIFSDNKESLPVLVDVLCSKRFRLDGTVYEHILQTLQSAVGSLGVGADEAEKIGAAVEALFKTKDDKFANIMNLIKTLGQVEETKKRSNFVDSDSQTKFLSKVGASFKEYLSQAGSLEETKEKPAYFAALTSILKLGFELGQDDTLKLVGLLEKDGKTQSDLLYVLETALHQLKGKDGTANDPAKWMDFLNDAKLDATGRLASAILVNVNLTMDQRVEFIKDKVSTWDKSGQGMILRSIYELAGADGFPGSGISPLVPLLKEPELTDSIFQVINVWVKNEKTGDIADQVKATIGILSDPEYGWIFDNTISQLFAFHENLINRGTDPKESGLLNCCLDFIHRGLDSDGNDDPPRYGTKLLLALQKHEDLLDDATKSGLAALLKSQINYNGDSEVKESLIEICVKYKWSNITMPDVAKILDDAPYKIEIIKDLIPLYEATPSEPVAQSLADYLAKSIEFGENIPDAVQKLLFSTKTTEVVVTLLKFLSNCVRISAPPLPDKWIPTILDFMEKRELPKVRVEQVEIIENMATLLFLLEVNYGLDQETWTRWKALIEKSGGNMRAQRYANLTQLAISDRVTTPEEKIDVNDYAKSWAAEWARFDPVGVQLLVRNIAANKGLKLATKLQIVCVTADMASAPRPEKEELKSAKEEHNPLETQGALYFHAISLMAESDDDLNNVDQLVKIKDKFKTHQLSALENLAKMLAKTYVLSQKWDEATAIFKTVITNQDPTVYDHLEGLKSIQNKDLKPAEKIQDLATLTKLQIPIAPFCSRVGLDLFSEPVSNLVTFLQSFEPGVITESEIATSDPWTWPTKLLRGFILSKITKDDTTHQKDTILQQFDPLWSTWTRLVTPPRFNTTHLSEDTQICKNLRETLQTLVGTTWDLGTVNFVTFLLSQIRPIPDFTAKPLPLTFPQVKTNWLKNTPPNEAITDESATTFFAKAKDTGFLDGMGKNLTALYTLTSCGVKAEDLIPFMDQLQGLELTSKLDELSIAIPTVKEQSGDFSLEKLSNYLQNWFLETKASVIFEISTTQKSIVVDMLKSMNQFENQKTNDFESLQEILAIMQKRLDHGADSGEELIKKQLMTYTTLIQAMYTYSLEIKTVLKVVQDEKTEISKWLSGLSIAPKSEDVKERSIDELMKLLEDSKSEGLDLPEIRKLYDSIIAKGAEWKDKKEDDVKSWAKKVNKDTDKAEVIAGLVQAVALTKKDTKPRNAQILALLTLTQSYEKGNGRLARVETGEGKSLIIALFAAYVKLTQDLKVDIVTPSSILAARDSHLFADFYTLLSLDSGFLTTIPTDKSYEKDVLYGDPQSLQSDCLRVDFHFEDDLRKKRPFSLVIVDEVDSMLIDQAANTTKLVEPVPGVEFLAPLFAAIWRIVNDTGNMLIPINNAKYCPQEVTKTDCTDLVSVLSQITKRHGPPSILTESVKNFAERMAELETKDAKAREALKLLIRNKLIPGDIGPADDPTTDDTLNKIIQKRWNTDEKTSLVHICGKFLGRKVQIWGLDAEKGLALSATYHTDQEPKDIPDHFKFLPIFEMEGKLVQLLEASGNNAASFLFNRVTEKIKALVVFSDDKNVDRDSDKLVLPQHFKSLYNFKLQRWIRSAITARYYVHEDQDYVLKVLDGDKHTRIVPVDWQNTGILEESSVWPDGVHQFLQIKHLLATTPEQITTNFLSNVSYFKRYGKNVFGLTGTLGSAKEKELLSKTYQVGTVNVPTFQAKRHALLKNMTLETSDEWIEAIVTSVVANVRLQRAVLLICKTIEEADHFKDTIETKAKDTGEQFDIQKYTRLDQTEETKVPENQLKGGSIIIATMLAGRGTDFQIDEKLAEKGGLHVILTFFPNNVRVEDQATGRAARKGQPGSSQLIVLAENEDVDRVAADWISKGTGILTESRDKNEDLTLDNVQKNVLPMITREDGHFQKYCTIRKKLADAGDDFDKKYTLAWLDEQWGIALDKAKPLEEGDPGQDVLQKEFDDKMASLEKAVDDQGKNYKDEIANPQTNLLLGAGYVQKGDDSSLKSGQGYLSKTISSDGHFAVNANYYQAYTHIKLGDSDYKKNASDELALALEGIMKSIGAQMAIHAFGNANKEDEITLDNEGNIKPKDKPKGVKDPEFTQQVKGRVHLLQLMLKSIQNAMKELQDSKEKTAKLIPVDEYIRAQKKDDSISEAERKEAEESGLIGFIEVVNKPTPWWAWFTVVLVCCLEVAAGAVLAAFTGGALGTGLIVDGIIDLAWAIKAAINGDYVSLQEFFINKAISMVIMVLTAGVGVVVAKFGARIAQFAAKWGTKFLQTSVGSVFESIFEFGKTMWSGLKGFVTKIGKAGYELLKTLGRGIRSLGAGALGLVKRLGTKINEFWETFKTTRAWQFLVRVGNKLKLPEALKYVIDGINKVKESLGKFATWIQTHISEPFITRVTPQSLRARQAAFTFKLVAKEFARRGALEGLDWILNSKLMPLLKGLIATELKKYVKDSVTKEITNGSTGPSMDKYLGNYTSKQSYEDAFRKMKNEKLIKIVQDELAPQNPKVEESMISALLSFADEAAEKLKSEKIAKGPTVKLAKIIENGAQLLVDVYRTVGVVTSIVKYTGDLFTRFRAELDKSNLPDPTDASYIKNADGKKEYESDKENLIEELSNQIADQMADIIVQGIIVPKTEQKITEIVSNMGVFKNNKVLEKLSEIQVGLGHPERFPQASIWDIYKGLKTNRDAEHAATVEEGVHLLSSSLSAMSAISGQSIEVYGQRDYGTFPHPDESKERDHKGPTLSMVWSAKACGLGEEEEPIRIAMSRRDWASRWQFAPVVRGRDGILRIVPTPMIEGANLMESVALMSKGNYEMNLANLKYIESLY
ncbi:uncharacterized protein LOC110857132 [Folsomia candida]|uniref:uncharacterized protein LOC110857132 n=1 Tax=Folsomia candida TaxID=158441 RepID=UPI001604BB0C|nr:uncharacterized protein LOC110857132 [Folsomia candida]